MSLEPRIQFVRVHENVMSSYPIGAPRQDLMPLHTLRSGFMVPEAADALMDLHTAITHSGGDFRVTDCLRPVDVQAEARQKYINWLKAGKPSRDSFKWNAQTMKNAFVSEPGYSFHNAGRAIDIHIDGLNFPNLAFDRQLDRLWEIARPLGWRPIIKDPWERASESWHFDYMGIWGKTYDVLGYKETAMCAGLDVGIDAYLRSKSRALQAQLHRCGMNVGSIDGYIGKKTRAGLAALDLPSAVEYAALYEISTSCDYIEHF